MEIERWDSTAPIASMERGASFLMTLSATTGTGPLAAPRPPLAPPVFTSLGEQPSRQAATNKSKQVEAVRREGLRRCDEEEREGDIETEPDAGKAEGGEDGKVAVGTRQPIRRGRNIQGESSQKRAAERRRHTGRVPQTAFLRGKGDIRMKYFHCRAFASLPMKV